LVDFAQIIEDNIGYERPYLSISVDKASKMPSAAQALEATITQMGTRTIS
jgi:hypothetical protein